MDLDNLKRYKEKEQTFAIKPFNHIRIGDPSYFEDMRGGDKNPALKELTCDIKLTRRYPVSGLRMYHEIYETEKGSKFGQIVVLFAETVDSRILDTYLSNKYLGDDTIKEVHQLGCDTASFEIEVDKRYDHFHTGADGYYGDITLYVEPYGISACLTFDADLFSYDEIKQRMNALFCFES